MSSSRLFQPLKVGNVHLRHRIGMAPLTRLRATEDRFPTVLMQEYYTQRCAVPGTLLIAEGTFVSENCGGFPNAPGIWNKGQIAAWRSITDAVHSRDCFIFCQLFAMGRAASSDVCRREGYPILGPSAIPIDDSAPVPEAMTLDEIEALVQDFVNASKNAIEAGFDGVEIHGANGYLIDQFIQDVSNQRDDLYGGSIDNRSRLVDRIVASVVSAIQPERVGLRLSPWSTFQGMMMEDPIPQFTDVILKVQRYKIAYLHLVESRIAGAQDSNINKSLDFAYKAWDGPILVAGGYTPIEAFEMTDKKHSGRDIVIIFGRHFISNPDLVYKINHGLELTKYKRSGFYTPESVVGYSDYPFCVEYLRNCS